ncbi:MAG TPA: four-helix bundle copper-binding protein [Nitrososphaeraceae archaeon]|nr:four-helix bundle copper-binding protein [Nitrososphaeraceae archaeon]
MTKLQSQKYRTCIDACNETVEASELCALKCLHEENVKSLAKCIELCATCSHIYSFASMAMSAESEYSKKICDLCAEICEACATECEKHSQDMEHCRLCAESCRRCAQECRNMS